MNLAQIRAWHFSQLENNIQSIERVIRMAEPTGIRAYRDGGTGWTALEVLGHLNDYESVFLQRAEVTVTQDEGALPFPKPDDLALEHDYNQQSLDAVMESWKARRAAHIAYLKARAEADWARVGIHPVRGPLSLMDQLSLVTLHDTLHLEQMTRALIERNTGS
jgi:uncharacterized damage-inducible protein DinB